MEVSIKPGFNNIFYIVIVLFFVTIVLCYFLMKQSAKYKIFTDTIKQPIHHDKSDGPFLMQRIKILIPDHLISRPAVFFILGNESTISDDIIINCFNMYGKRNDLIFILAEHRGYGESVSLDEDQTVPKYVSIDQALADYHTVIQKYHLKYPGPWIVAGYSYGGGLSINFGYKYPNDAQVILSSSGVVNWNFLLDSYENQSKENIGIGLYTRLIKHVQNLTPEQPFDQKWKDRELIYSFVSGVSQYERYNKSFKTYIDFLSYLPTGLFVGTLKVIDSFFAKGAANDYVVSNSKISLSRAEATSGKYSWRVWRYQQFNETGTLWSSQVNGLYQNSTDDWIKECKLLFREEPPLLTKKKWDVLDMADKLRVPLVYVNGGKDPWKGVCLPKAYKIKNGSYIDFKDSFHCPDRETINGIKVINEVLKYLKKG